MPWLVQTDEVFGLTTDDVARALRILNGAPGGGEGRDGSGG